MPPLVGVFEEGSTYKLEGANDPLQKNMIKKGKKTNYYGENFTIYTKI